MPLLEKKKEMCELDCHSGNWKGFYFDLFVVKEPNYIVVMMSTYYGLMYCDDQKEEYRFSKVQVLTFKYT